MKKVDISEAKSLLSFNFAGTSLQELVCGTNCVTVKTVSFRVSEYNPQHLKVITDAFPNQETLSLHPSFAPGSKCLPTFSSIKNLELMLAHHDTENLRPQILDCLDASPSLNKLELHISKYLLPRLHEKNHQNKKIPFFEDYEHSNLKKVVVYNFGREARNVELLKQIISDANFLEKIIIRKDPLQRDFSFVDFQQTLPSTVKLQVL